GLGRRGHPAVPAVGLPRRQQGRRERVPGRAPRWPPAQRGRRHADPRGTVRPHRLPRLRAEARRAVRREEVSASGPARAAGPPEHRSTKMSDTTATATFKPKKSVALSGTAAGNTALCTVGRSGNDLHYRGYDILD